MIPAHDKEFFLQTTVSIHHVIVYNKTSRREQNGQDGTNSGNYWILRAVNFDKFRRRVKGESVARRRVGEDVVACEDNARGTVIKVCFVQITIAAARERCITEM